MTILKGDMRPGIRRALASVPRFSIHGLWLGCAAALLSLPVQAQVATTTPESENAPLLEQVIITGSRIPVSQNERATSPIQVVTAQDVTLSGYTDTTSVINALPQNIVNFVGDIGNNSAALNTPGGISTADLRGLGPQRTLVLVDGKRLGPGDPNTANVNVASDLDQVPAAMIERIDVVTGGASATYGSDAIAGVVNFIMRKNFEGIEITGEYGEAQHGNHERWLQSEEEDAGFSGVPTGSVVDGRHRDLSILMGANVADGAGNITGYFTYHTQDPVAGAARDFGDCELLSNVDIGAPPPENVYNCEGSSNSNRYTVAGSTNRYTVVGSQLLPWPQAGSSPPAIFNADDYEYMQREDERYNAGFFSHLDINDYVKPYLDFSFMNDKTQILIAPSGLFTGLNTTTADGNYLINCSNPLLSAQEQGVLCTPAQITADTAVPGSASADVEIGRRNIEGGGRLQYYEHTNFRVVGGVKGDFGDAWSYDASGQFAYTTFFNDNEHYLNYASIDNALQVTGTAADPKCISGGACVPYDIFTTGAVTPAQLNYLYTPGTSYGQSWEEVAHVDVTGELGKYGITSPLAHDGLAFNIGAEHRFEAIDFNPDGAELAGDLAGFGGAAVAIDQGYSVKEAFTELRVPLIQDKPGVHDLSIDAGYRDSDYSTAGNIATYKFEVQYAPTEDFRLRYSFDRAIRAPNLIELFNPQVVGGTSAVGIDPCAPTISSNGAVVPATASLATCMRSGVTAAQYGNGGTTNSIPQCVSDQCSQLLGGNPQLKPETAETYSVGFTVTPRMLPGFSGSIDYFHINLTNEVNSIPGGYLLSDCLANGDAASCSQIVRNHANGSLDGTSIAGGGYVIQTDVNAGASLYSGIDLQAAYRVPLGGMGALTAAVNGSYIQHTETTPFPGAHTYDCAGLFGNTCQSVDPRWRHNLRVNWETPWSKLLLSANWRFIGKSENDNNSTDPSLHFVEVGSYDVVNAVIPNYSYLDLSAIWPVYAGIELRGGVNNLFDKDPPIINEDFNNGSNPNSFPTYDYLGRMLYISVKAKF